MPLRPYSAVWKTDFQPIRLIASHGVVGDLFGALLIVVISSSVFGTIANLTTGRTLNHAGFTANPNITTTIGLVPIMQLIPFVFGGFVLLGLYAVFERHLPGGL